jgi:hypothetical protein
VGVSAVLIVALGVFPQQLVNYLHAAVASLVP